MKWKYKIRNPKRSKFNIQKIQNSISKKLKIRNAKNSKFEMQKNQNSKTKKF